MDFPFEGIPTVPPRKDMDHMASISIVLLLRSLLWLMRSGAAAKFFLACRHSFVGAADTE